MRTTFRYLIWYWDEEDKFVHMKTDSFWKFMKYRLFENWKTYEITRRSRVKLAKKYE